MKSIADQLPPEIARQIHPNRRKNEADYCSHNTPRISCVQGGADAVASRPAASDGADTTSSSTGRSLALANRCRRSSN